MEIAYYIAGALALGIIAGILLHKYLPSSKLGVEAGKVEVWAHNEFAGVDADLQAARLKAVADITKVAPTVVADVETVVKDVSSVTLSGVESTLVTDAVGYLGDLITKLTDTSAEDAAIAKATSDAAAVVAQATASKAAKSNALAALRPMQPGKV